MQFLGSSRPLTDASLFPSHHRWSACAGVRVVWPSLLPPWPLPVSGLTFEAFPSTASLDLLRRCKHRRSRSRSAACVTFTPLQRLSFRAEPSPAPLSCASPCRPSTSAPLSVYSQLALPLAFGPTVPTVRSRSVLVVSHHLDGLLRCEAFGLVASRNRPWGPSRFQLPTPASSDPALTGPSSTGVSLE